MDKADRPEPARLKPPQSIRMSSCPQADESAGNLPSAFAAETQRQSFKEVAQYLIAAKTEVLMARLAEQGSQFRLGKGESGALEDLVRVHVFQLGGSSPACESMLPKIMRIAAAA